MALLEHIGPTARELRYLAVESTRTCRVGRCDAVMSIRDRSHLLASSRPGRLRFGVPRAALRSRALVA